jgi:hypothetical protein
MYIVSSSTSPKKTIQVQMDVEDALAFLSLGLKHRIFTHVCVRRPDSRHEE